jgi:hypothetical protein
LTGKDKLWLAAGALAFFLIGTEVGKILTLRLLKAKFHEAKDARPQPAAAPAPDAAS